ncbi:MAG: NAD-dependent epimerase/dehydratase family protein [Promethearchaeota archaeon]
MSKILCTGGCGFVGLHMVEFLLAKGHQIRALDIHKCKEIMSREGIEFVQCDITQRQELNDIFTDVDYAFHIAALFDYSASWEQLHRVNVIGSRNLCEVALNSNIKRIVVWSSGSVYGIPKKTPVGEDIPPKPLNNYEKSKLEQERVFLDCYNENDLPVTIIRPAAIYGPRGKYGVSQMLLMLAEGKLPGIPGPGKYKPALVHVKDIINAAYFLHDKENSIGEIYNIGDEGKYTMEELLLAAAEILDIKIRRFHIPVSLLNLYALIHTSYSKIRKKKPRLVKDLIRYVTYDSVLNSSKIKHLGYNLLYPDTIMGLKETIDWYKEVGWV